MRKFVHNVMIRRAPYDQTRAHDIYLSKFVEEIRGEVLTKKDDDYLLLIVGPPGTGKSHLMMHIYEEFDPIDCSVDYIGLDRSEFADALKQAKNRSSLRFVANDEANINKRDSLTKYNKAILDLYMSIRGLNIFHVWDNPSAEMIDKAFIKERVKGLILIYDKSPERRTYWFFKAETLTKIFERIGNLDLATLIKNRHLAYYQGWFRPYSGKLLEAYLTKKNKRMEDKVDTFHKAWGTGPKQGEARVTRAGLGKRLGVTSRTIIEYEKELLRDGLLMEGINYFTAPTGIRYFADNVYELFLDRISVKQQAGNGRFRVRTLSKGSTVE